MKSQTSLQSIPNQSGQQNYNQLSLDERSLSQRDSGETTNSSSATLTLAANNGLDGAERLIENEMNHESADNKEQSTRDDNEVRQNTPTLPGASGNNNNSNFQNNPQQQQLLVGINNLQQAQTVIEQIENTVVELRTLNKHKPCKDLFGFETCSILCNDPLIRSRGIVDKILGENETIELLMLTLANGKKNGSSRSKYKILNGSNSFAASPSNHNRRRASSLKSSSDAGPTSTDGDSRNRLGSSSMISKQQSITSQNSNFNNYQCDTSTINSSDDDLEGDQSGRSSNSTQQSLNRLTSNIMNNNFCNNLITPDMMSHSLEAATLLGSNLTKFLQQQQQQQAMRPTSINGGYYQQHPMFKGGNGTPFVGSTSTSTATPATATTPTSSNAAIPQPIPGQLMQVVPNSLVHLSTIDLAQQQQQQAASMTSNKLLDDSSNKDCDIRRLLPFMASFAASKQSGIGEVMAAAAAHKMDCLSDQNGLVINRNGNELTSTKTSTKKRFNKRNSMILENGGYSERIQQQQQQQQHGRGTAQRQSARQDIDHQVSDNSSSSGALSDSDRQRRIEQQQMADSIAGSKRRRLQEQQNYHPPHPHNLTATQLYAKAIQQQQQQQQTNGTSSNNKPSYNTGIGYTAAALAHLAQTPNPFATNCNPANSVTNPALISAVQQQQQQQQQQRQTVGQQQLSPQQQRSLESLFAGSSCRTALLGGGGGGGGAGAAEAAATHAHYQQQAMLLQQHLFLNQLAMGGGAGAGNGNDYASSAMSSHPANNGTHKNHSDLIAADQQQQQQQQIGKLNNINISGQEHAAGGNPLPDSMLLARSLASSLNGSPMFSTMARPTSQKLATDLAATTPNSLAAMAAYEASLRQQQQQDMGSMISHTQNQVAAMNFIHQAQQHLQLRLAAAAAATAAAVSATNSWPSTSVSSPSNVSPAQANAGKTGAPGTQQANNEEIYLF